jgi:hypothetical protein
LVLSENLNDQRPKKEEFVQFIDVYSQNESLN